MPFGIHQGKDVSEIPRDYLVFLSRQRWFVINCERLFNEFIKELDEREKFGIEG